MTRIRPKRMWKVFFAALMTLVLAAACGGDTDDQLEPAAAETTAPPTTAAPTTAAPQTTAAPETTTTNAAQTTTVPESTTTEAPGFEPVLLSYNYPSDGELEYSISIEQQAEVELEGGPSEGMPPGPIEMNTILAGAISYTISPGPDEDTVSIRIVSDIQMVENEATMGGFSIPASELGEAPGFETPIDITVITDSQGNVLEVSSEGFDDLFGGMNLQSASSVGNQHLSRPFGPAFPDTPLGVGDSWTEQIEQEGPFGSVVTNAAHIVVAVEGTEESPILVVESQYRTDAFEWDMSEMMLGMFGAFAEEDSSEEGQEDQESPGFFGDIQLLVSATPGVVHSTVRFDPGIGLVIEGEQQAQGEVATSMTMPGEAGETFTIITGVKFDQQIFFQLIGPAA
ncbi:MAG: hypothetical protein OXS33_13475 [bacterium]|nr:hypothetical protein [bacterium]